MKKLLMILASVAVLFTGCKEDTTTPEVPFTLTLESSMIQIGNELTAPDDAIILVSNPNRTITVELAYTDSEELAALEVSFTGLPEGVSAEGFTFDFTGSKTKDVDFTDGTNTITYKMSAEAGDPEPHFVSLTVGGQTPADGIVKLSGTTDLTAVPVEFTVSPAQTKVFVGDNEISSGDEVDFSDKVNGVTFTLTCEGVSETEKVTVVTTGINEIERVWGHYAVPPTDTEAWFGVGDVRAATGDWMRNVAMDNQYVYLPHASGTPGIYAVSLTDGSFVKALSTEGIASGTHLTSDAEVMDNGTSTILLVCNLASNEAGALKVYAYDNIDAAPRVVLNYPLSGKTLTPRLGDKMTAEGTWQDGKLYFFDQVNATSRRVFAFAVKDGVVSTTPDIIDLGAAVTGNSISGIYKYSNTEYIWMGTAGYAKVYSASGTTFTESYAITDGTKWSHPQHGARFFDFNDESYMSFVTLSNAYQDGELRIVPLAGQTLAEAIEATDQSAGRVLGIGHPTETGTTSNKNANAACDTALRTINGEIYIVAGACNIGVSLFKIK